MKKSLWTIEKVEQYSKISNVTTKTIIELPKCPYCGMIFEAIAFDYNYCPVCGKQMYKKGK